MRHCNVAPPDRTHPPTSPTSPGRNDACPCGSGRKFKRCCGAVSPPTPANIYRDAVAAVRAGRAAEAERLFAAVIRQQPHRGDALTMLGLLTGRAGRYAEAIALLERAIATGEHSAEARLVLANVQREAGKIDAAIHTLEDAVRRHPADAALVSDLGLAYLQGQRPADAVAVLERAVALDPKSAAATYNLACAFERQRRYAEALATYERAVVIAPGLAQAHSRMGNLLHAQGRRDDALASFRRAAVAAPGTTLGRLNDVKLLMEQERSGEAEALLRTITADDPRSAEACRLLGNTLRETGRFDEAIVWLERAIATDRTQIAAYHDLAFSRRHHVEDRAFIDQMKRRLTDADLNDHERTLLHFAVGKCLDDLGEWADAIEQFDAGNALERRSLAFDRTRFAAQIDLLIGRITRDFIAAHAQFANHDATPVLVLGMPRSGTTLVEQIVSSHPLAAGAGELRFWNERSAPALDATPGLLTAACVESLAHDYLAMVRNAAPDAARVVDKMPFNFMWAGLIHLVLPRATIVHCRRHPVDTCLSIYFTRFATRQDFAYDRDDLVFYYRNYRRLMDHWRGVIDPARFLDLDYEALINDRESMTRRLLAFIGLPWNDACLAPESNTRVVKTASMWQARQPVYRTSVARWRHYEPWLGSLRGLAMDVSSTYEAERRD